jgi:hypothetical protein
MLLYDRLFRQVSTLPQAFSAWERWFNGVPVFDLSDAASALHDMTESSLETLARHVPKRPPFTSMWVEYTMDRKVYLFDEQGPQADIEANITSGFLFCEASDEESAILRAEIPPLGGWMHIYLARPYEVWNTRSHPGTTPVGAPLQVAKIYAIGFSEDWQKSALSFKHIRPQDCPLRGLTTQVDPDTDNSPVDPYEISIPLSCFALLNCRNVVAETVHQDKKHPRVKGERDHRPYCSYKVLRLEVPHRLAERSPDAALDADDDGPKVRLHLCRGHFKNLQHERYKNARGWHWWPAHWKGSADLGRSDKSYKLTAAIPA